MALVFFFGGGFFEMGSHCVAHIGLENSTCLSQPPEYWDCRRVQPHLAVYVNFKFKNPVHLSARLLRYFLIKLLRTAKLSLGIRVWDVTGEKNQALCKTFKHRVLCLWLYVHV
jgi:hypothetical protein